jgi:hypothetical protein
MMEIHYCEFGPPPTEDDNRNHPPTTDNPWWQESGLFTWGDPRRGFGGELRLGIHPNQQVANAYVWIVWDGATLYRRIIADQPLPSGDLLNGTIGGATFTTIKPLMVYDLEFTAPDLELRLRWSNFRWPVSTKLNVGGATLAAGHYDMMGEVQGEITVRGAAHRVGGAGFMDHSWGVRRAHLPASRSYFCVVDSSFYLAAMPVLGLGGERRMLGYVFADDKLGRIGTDSRLGYSLRDDWITVAGCDSYFYDEFDRAFHIIGRTIGTASSQPMGHGKLVHHAVAEFEIGGRLGRGILEQAHPKHMRPDLIEEIGLDPKSWWLNEGH